MTVNGGVSWLALFAGLGVGSIVAAILTRWSSISDHRQKWINALREDIALFLQEVDKIRESVAAATSPDDHSDRNEKLVEAREARSCKLLVYRRILLRLNLTESPHIELAKLLREVAVVEPRFVEESQIDAIVNLARRILKHEWAVAKYGIFRTPIMYMKSLWRPKPKDQH